MKDCIWLTPGNANGGVLPRSHLQRYGEERYAESIAACRSALERRPNYAEAWNNICAAYNKLGRYEEAAAACEQALRYKTGFLVGAQQSAIRSQEGEGFRQIAISPPPPLGK